MLSSALATVLAGAGTAGATALIALVKWTYETKQSAEETHRLLVGSDEIEQDGVIEIVEENRRMARTHREVLKQSDAVPHPRQYE